MKVSELNAEHDGDGALPGSADGTGPPRTRDAGGCFTPRANGIDISASDSPAVTLFSTMGLFGGILA
jgi:hypothetical protein